MERPTRSTLLWVITYVVLELGAAIGLWIGLSQEGGEGWPYLIVAGVLQFFAAALTIATGLKPRVKASPSGADSEMSSAR